MKKKEDLDATIRTWTKREGLRREGRETGKPRHTQTHIHTQLNTAARHKFVTPQLNRAY